MTVPTGSCRAAGGIVLRKRGLSAGSINRGNVGGVGARSVILILHFKKLHICYRTAEFKGCLLSFFSFLVRTT